jgi:hypothetical protein
MAGLKSDFARACESAQSMIDDEGRGSPLEARVLRFQLGRQLIAVDKPEAARAVLLKALSCDATVSKPGVEGSVRQSPARALAAGVGGGRLDVEVLRAIGATYRSSDLAKSAEYLRASLEVFKRLSPADQRANGRGTWNAALVLANVLAESGASGEAADVLEWAYREDRLERSSNEEFELVLMAAEYARDAGRRSDSVATCAWLVVHASDWVWGSTDHACVPRRTLQDAVAAELLTQDGYVELMIALSYVPEAKRQPAAFARIAYDGLVFSTKVTDGAIAQGESALKLLLSTPVPSVAVEAKEQDRALQSVLSGLAFIYRGDARRGIPERPADLNRVQSIWKTRFPDSPLVVE